MPKQAEADLWVKGYWADEPTLSECDAWFASGFCQQLRQYRQRVAKAPPVAEAGRTDPRANLLLSAADSTAAQALARLVVGQARLAWRLADAWTWLTPALQSAAGCAGPLVYLPLQRDLEVLKELPLFDQPRSRPQTRGALLREARMIRYLRTGRA